MYILAAVCCMLAACTRRVMVRRYYLIEVEPTQISKIEKFEKKYDISVDVRDFTVDRAYRQTSIVLRSGTHELNYYYYHYWAVRPGLAIADMVYRITDYSGLFKSCFRGFSYKPRYVIQGNIQQIERVQQDKAVSAHVKGKIHLTGVESGDILVQHTFDRITGLGSKNGIDALVAEISAIVFDETNKFLIKCDAYLGADKKKQP